jgi:hypothetical protein
MPSISVLLIAVHARLSMRLARWLMMSACAAAGSAGAQDAAPPAGSAPALYLARLQQHALAQGLAQDPMWHKLLHYQHHPVSRRLRSLADDPGFFNAPEGRHDPQAELAATLAAFFDPRRDRVLDQAAQCRFAARYAWLHERLKFDDALLAPQPCERLDQWLRGLDVARVSLVFPSAFLNSPGSMYGHTFLRLDPRGAAGAQPLLSYAISYAANGSEAEGAMFALKGVFGGYDGVLTTSPYYLRIRDYTHLENRDIWEYPLNLDAAQIDRMLRHAWELSTTRFSYYFFDENCSYHLLSLLDVAREDLFLSAQFPWWAIPVDTVRAVAQAPGLLQSRRYRPSNGTELRWRAAGLPPQAVDLARDLAQGRAQPADAAGGTWTGLQQAQVLELAERYATFLGTRGALADEQVQQTRLALLGARALLPQTPNPEVPVPALAPQDGHRTGRVDLDLGRRDGQPFWRLGWRSSYHELLDPEAGYTRGAQIEIGHIEIARTQAAGVQLDRATAIDILSLAPRERLLGGTSWKVRLGLERTWPRANGAAPSALALGINGGPGYAFELGDSQQALAYAMLDNQIWYDPSLGSQRWALGTGAQLGLLWDLSSRWRAHLQGYRRVFAGQGPAEWGTSLQQRWAVDDQHNATLRCDWQARAGQAMRRSCSAGVQRYW